MVFSEYKEPPAAENEQLEQFTRLIACFPLLTPAWQMEFYRAIKRHKLGARRLADAVSHIIDTCNFQAPRIAEIVNFDKGVRLYTQREVAEKVSAGWSDKQTSYFWDSWPVVVVEGNYYRVSAAELAEKGLKVENKTIYRAGK